MSRRLVAVLVIQAVAIGVLATGALGTPSRAKIGGPVISALVSVDHDTSVPLADATPTPRDPNRIVAEVERQPRTSVSAAITDPAVQASIGGTAIPATDQSFDGLQINDLSALLVPPDPVGDVGPTQYVQAVNGGLAVFSKTGANLGGAVDDLSFWSGMTGCESSLSDPTINYDAYADRWVYNEMGYTSTGGGYTGPFYICTAVSATGDATGSWYRYSFGVGNSYLPDYPKLGVWTDGYYLSFNLYDTSGSFHGAGAMALDRSSMLNGASAQAVYLDLSTVAPNQGGMLPSDADGAQTPPAGAPNYYVSPLDDPTSANNDQLGIWAFHVDWTAPGGSTFTNPQNLPVAAFDGNGVSVPQPGTLTQLDGLADDRLMNRVQYRNFGGYETLVTNETVKNNGVDAPRWYELRHTAGSWNVAQQSTYAPDGLYRWMGSVAMDGAGDMALGYSAGDGATAPGLRYTGRLAADPLSTMPQGEGTLVAGGGSQTGTNRWGDYSQMTVDPTDDCTFWYTGEYYPVTSPADWHTRIGSFRFPGCVTSSGPTYTVVPSISGTAREGATLTASPGTWSPAPTSTAYQWRRCDANGLSCADIGSATASTYVLQPADAGKRVRVKVTVTAATGTSSVSSAATATVLPLPPVNAVLPAVSGTLQMGSTISAAVGTWTSALAPVYTYQWQRCTASCADIVGATGASYTLANPGDVGATMRVAVTATNAGGLATVYSPQSSVVQIAPGPVNTVAPWVTGTAQVGQLLTAHIGTWTGVATITYAFQWQTCSSAGTNCVPLSGATGGTYPVQVTDVGNKLRVVVTASNSGGASAVNSPMTLVAVPTAPINQSLPALGGSTQVGAALVTSAGTWLYATTITYQWQRCTGGTCLNITNETTTSHDVTSADIGSTLRAAVTATNVGGSNTVFTSQSATVTAPVGSSGGSGGGGGAGSPDLAVTGTTSSVTPNVGDNVTFFLTVTDTNLKPAQILYVNIALPAGLTYVSSTTDRGSGCAVVNGSSLNCFLDWLSSGVSAGHLQIVAKVTASGAQVLTATATSLQGVLTPANSTLSLTVTAPGSKTAGGIPTGLNGDGSTPTKTAVPDKVAPTARALDSTAKRGSAARLRFRIYDDRGVAKALATVKRNGKTFATTKTGFGSVAFGTTYYLGWHVPALAPKGTYRFCVVAVDRTGNHSRSSCAALVLK